MVEIIRHDPLVDHETGLRSRQWLRERFASYWRGVPVTLVLVLTSIDELHSSTTLGRDQQSGLHTAVGQAVCAAAQSGDVCVHLGNGEFLTLLEDSSLLCGRQLGHRILSRVATTVRAHNKLSPCTVSVGVASGASVTPSAVLRDTELALGAAQRGGGDQIVLLSAASVETR